MDVIMSRGFPFHPMPQTSFNRVLVAGCWCVFPGILYAYKSVITQPALFKHIHTQQLALHIIPCLVFPPVVFPTVSPLIIILKSGLSYN